MTTAETPLVLVLADWQREARTLAEQVPVESHPEGVLASERVAARSAAVRRVRTAMMPRETSKQRFVWPLIRSCFGDGDRVVAELKSRKRTLERELIAMRWADERAVAFDEQIRTFLGDVEDYLGYEHRLLPRIATEIPGADQDRAFERLLAPSRLLPIGPHPDLPAAPWLVPVLGPAAGIVDRLRDRFLTAPG